MLSPLFFLEFKMKNGRSLIDLAVELERQLATKKDMIVPSSLMHHQTRDNGACMLVIDESDGSKRYDVTELARRQLAEKLKIPYAYFERMRVDQPGLLDRNVNTWLQSESADKRLIRTLDGRVRAVLSDRYRRLDNFDLAENVLPILQRLPEAQFESIELTETRMYLKVPIPQLGISVFIVPAKHVKGVKGKKTDRVLVCNTVAQSVVDLKWTRPSRQMFAEFKL
jgi:hypothetical protein